MLLAALVPLAVERVLALGAVVLEEAVLEPLEEAVLEPLEEAVLEPLEEAVLGAKALLLESALKILGSRIGHSLLKTPPYLPWTGLFLKIVRFSLMLSLLLLIRASPLAI